MDELVMMEKIMSDMFDDEDGMEQIGEFDRKSGFYFIPITPQLWFILYES